MTAKTQNKFGCLGSILRIFRASKSTSEQRFPYQLTNNFLSSAELTFYQSLCAAANDDVTICPKVRLSDVFNVSGRYQDYRYQNKINQKHIDFLVCHASSMKPLVGIELDDSSHQLSDRKERDKFVNAVFEAAGLPLLRIPARRSYNPQELAAQLAPYLSAGTSTPERASPRRLFAESDTPLGVPICPKCGARMVVRKSHRGEFYGCRNYPTCRQTMPIA